MTTTDDKLTASSKIQGTNVQPVYVSVPPPSDAGIDLVELWIVLWNGKWLIAIVSAIFAIAGVVYSLSITPIYRAEVILAPVSRNQPAGLGELGGLASLAGISLNTSGDSNQSLAILKSRNFVGEYIRDKDLLPVLFADEWDVENQRWIVDDQEQGRDFRDGVKVFIDNVRSIAQDAQTGLVTLSIEWTDPEVAAQWATELVQRINDRTRRRDIEESQRKLDYLNDQLGKANLVELRLAISRVIEEQISAMMLAQSQIEYAFEVIDPAVVPKKRIRPKRTVIVIVATLLGCFSAMFVLIVRFAIKRLQAEVSG